jgi:hypothetical protein
MYHFSIPVYRGSGHRETTGNRESSRDANPLNIICDNIELFKAGRPLRNALKERDIFNDIKG